MSRSVENVIKQGYLKKGNASGNRLSGLLRKIEGQKWFVFTIRSGVPYLDYYDNDTEMFSQRPKDSYCLNQCHNITSLGRTNPPTFSITFSNRYVELIAATRNQMLEWVNDIERTLTRLGILKKECGEHVYTVLPAVVRQPRVSQQAAEEREPMEEAPSVPSSSRSLPNRPPDPSPAADDDDPPPLPYRPPPRVPRTSVRNRPIEQSFKKASAVNATGKSAEVKDGSADAAPSQIHCSNDSDFVSWDVVMQVRENFLRRSGTLDGKTGVREFDNGAECPVSGAKAFDNGAECPVSGAKAFDNGAEGFDYGAEGFDYGAEGFDDSEMSTRTNFSDNESESDTDFRVSVFGDCTLSPMEETKGKIFESDDALDLSTLPSDYSPFPSVGSESEMSFNMDRMSKKADIEENEYSFFPGGLRDEVQEKSEIDEEVKLAAKPVPLPRRALSLRADPLESNQLRNGMRDEPGARNLPSLEEADTTGDLIDLECRPFEDLNSENDSLIPSDDAKNSDNKDENENFYDSQNSKVHSVLAPPSIPPRCDSLVSGAIQTSSLSSHSNQDSNICDFSDFYSHPMSSSRVLSLVNPSSNASKVMSIPSMDLSSNKETTSSPPEQAPAIPPLPLPRRTTTKKVQSAFDPKDKPSIAASMDIPKLPPRRAFPGRSISFPDTPPALPSRNSKGCSMKKPLLSACSSISESSDKDFKEQQMFGEVGPYSKVNKSATIGAAAGSRQSGLSKKMLLDRANSLHTVVSLKQTQAEILQAEIDKSHVNVTLTQKSGHGLALVDWNNMPCVAGWNQKDFPSLHAKLHIGDMLISVNNVRVTSSAIAQKLLKHASEPKIEVMLQRMPYAKVFAIRRSAEGQSLGLKREGGTAEILYVDPNGLAAEHGLPQYAQGTMGKSRCTWFLTEINSRPLNLFFKENEIEHRLYAVGREISIVVQPSDFIFELRHGLKKVKSYKNYITQ